LPGADDGAPRPFERVIELRGASHSGKTYLLQAAALAAADQSHALVHAVLDTDATNPDGVALGAYADKLLTQLRQDRTPRQQRRARLLESPLADAVVNVQLQPTGWDTGRRRWPIWRRRCPSFARPCRQAIPGSQRRKRTCKTRAGTAAHGRTPILDRHGAPKEEL